MRIGQTFSTIDDILNEFDGDELPSSIIPSLTSFSFSIWFNWEDHSVMSFELSDNYYWILNYISNEEDKL